MSRNNKIFVTALLIIFLGSIPFLHLPPYIIHILILCILYAFLGTAWNILGGYAGLISFGHSSFFGLAAYTLYFLTTVFSFPASVGMFIAALIPSTLCSLIFAPAFKAKLRGAYFVLLTILLTEVLRELFTSFREATGGSFGVNFPFFRYSIEHFQFPELWPYLYLIIGLYILTLIFWERAKKLQLYLKVIKENPDIASFYGANVLKYIVIATLLSGFLAGLGGSFYMLYTKFIDPATAFSVDMSISLVLLTTFGGQGTTFGPLIGSLILTPISEALRIMLGGTYYGVHIILYGLLLIIVTFHIPEGVYGKLKKL